MTSWNASSRSFPYKFAFVVLASALALPAWSQSQATTDDSQAAPTAQQAAQQQAAMDASTVVPPAKEGFWGHLNPFARKKWVKKQIDPLNDRLTELDQVNAKNAQAIQDVDSRAQAGIRHAQSTADSANQQALAAGSQAKDADSTADQASNHVQQLNTTVNGLDQYRLVTDVEVHFRGGSPALTAEARKQLDDLAANLSSRQGYILEMDAHSPAAGSAGIQSSERLAEAVKRYLVTEHQIPVYRMHSVALGNVQAISTDEDASSRRVRTSSVHIRLMENSLAAQAAAPPQGVAASTGMEQP